MTPNLEQTMWTSSREALAALHARYVAAVNRAVAEGRDDLVAELESDYAAECAQLLHTQVDPAA